VAKIRLFDKQQVGKLRRDLDYNSDVCKSRNQEELLINTGDAASNDGGGGIINVDSILNMTSYSSIRLISPVCLNRAADCSKTGIGWPIMRKYISNVMRAVI